MENTINITVDSNVNINGLSNEHVESLVIALRAQWQGYNYIKSQSFSQQKEIFYQLQPELKNLTNKEFRASVEKQFKQGKDCEDILNTLEAYQKSIQTENKDIEAKVVSLNK